MTFIIKKRNENGNGPTKKSWPNFLGITWLPEATWAHCNGIKSLCNGPMETWCFDARMGQVSKKTVALGKWAKLWEKHDYSRQPKKRGKWAQILWEKMVSWGKWAPILLSQHDFPTLSIEARLPKAYRPKFLHWTWLLKAYKPKFSWPNMFPHLPEQTMLFI
jgi:hypothetical protein